MEIKNATSAASVGGTRPAASQPQAENEPRRLSPDQVSTVDTSRMADMARAVQGNVRTMRTVRLAHIEDAIRSGNYEPSASRIASALLDAAEIDGHLRALLGNH
jgi:anti-sigma28 factor (negative regulator of flagellin synthesis)